MADVTYLPYPASPFPSGWEQDPAIDDGHRHTWEMVVVEVRPGTNEACTRCAVCGCPRCGSTFADDPCLSRRHHRDPHIHESGLVRPIGGSYPLVSP